MKPVKIELSPRAKAVVKQLPPEQYEQAQRLARAIRMSPQAGAFFGHDGDGRTLYIASASNVHLIYSVVFFTFNDVVFIVDVRIIEWEPKHPGNEDSTIDQEDA